MMKNKKKGENQIPELYFIPNDTLRCCLDQNTSGLKITNPYLVFYKFTPMSSRKEEKLKPGYHKSVQILRNIFHSSNFRDLSQKVFERHEILIRELVKNGFLKREMEMKLTSKLCIGLGISNVNEVGIALHHIYGIPYIPASSVKGVTRLYACYYFISKWVDVVPEKPSREHIPDLLVDLDNLVEGKETKHLKNINENHDLTLLLNSFRRIFGTVGEKGSVIFMDSYPSLDFNVEIDIMNPHYSDYYTEAENDKEPGDWSNPKPILFPVIREGTRFKFVLLSKEKGLLDVASSYLESALTTIGIGAKTSLGYGIFTKCDAQ